MIFTIIPSLGEITGMLIFAPLADKYGRRIIIQTGYLLIIIFGFASSVSPDIYFLIVVRMLVGIGVGASYTVSYDLFAETVPTFYRNRIGYITIFSIFGAEYVILSGYLILSDYGWRWMAFVNTFPMLLLAIVGYFYLPESPRWLLSQGRYDEATAVLLHAAVLNEAKEKLGEIIIIPLQHEEKMEYYHLFFDPYLQLNLILWSVWLLGSFASYCVYFLIITYFALGQCSFQFGFLALASFFQICGILIAAQVINILGRVPSQIIYFTIASIFMLMYGVVIGYIGSSLGAIIMLFLAQICTTSAIMVMWVHTIELFPTEVRLFICLLLIFFCVFNFLQLIFYSCILHSTLFDFSSFLLICLDLLLFHLVLNLLFFNFIL